MKTSGGSLTYKIHDTNDKERWAEYYKTHREDAKNAKFCRSDTAHRAVAHKAEAG